MHDIEMLKPGEWVNDTVIMAYAHVASLESKRVEYRDSARTMLLLDTYFGQKLQIKDAYKQVAALPLFQHVLWIALVFSTPDRL